ncbi:LemA family protein [Phyllobacterium leguminum]|uniref:LemA protein n=1 Tax=Phyllobacterium leguminum TaxID=314237 RepID=A0A318T258_9HYPH|nr:LemA family protein [Phyllobacterium leguminum]PYE87992.1 LemA protein [Phyllobacterium leguminum]
MTAVTISRPFGRRLLSALLLAVLTPLLSACGFNTIPTQEEQVKAAWSQVLNQYQRRTDLIPNLVATVQGYATHEQQTFTDVVNARAKATQATVQLPPDALNNPQLFKEFEQNQANLTGALGRLMAIAENYPDLKANQNFLALQSQLEGTENRIAVARRDYIEAVRVYNTSLQTLPTMLWKLIWFHDNKPLPTFSISEQAQQAPTVKFNN